jgi:hypothetical protein
VQLKQSVTTKNSNYVKQKKSPAFSIQSAAVLREVEAGDTIVVTRMDAGCGVATHSGAALRSPSNAF